MKFKVDSKEHGNTVKKAILFLEKEMTHVTVAHVKDILSEPVEDEDRDYSWDVKALRLQRKLRVRETSTGWYLYFPEPEYIPYGDKSDPESERFKCLMPMPGVCPNTYYHRKCMVWRKSKKKNVLVEEYPCICTGSMINPIVKDNITIAMDLLYICEFQDGHVERVRFDHIRFVDKWD